MKPTKWQKLSYLRGELLQNIYYDKMTNRNNVMAGNKTIKNVFIIIIHRTHLDQNYKYNYNPIIILVN